MMNKTRTTIEQCKDCYKVVMYMPDGEEVICILFFSMKLFTINDVYALLPKVISLNEL